MNTIDQIVTHATALGRVHGQMAGSWVIDGNTSEATARRILKGYNDGDPEVMDMQPLPLSGEFADGPTVSTVLHDLGVSDEINETTDEFLTAFEDGYSESYWDTVVSACNHVVGVE
jgi:hypothetical protein